MAYTTIDNPSEYFEIATWTGNGSTQNITGLNFQPDMTWIKERNYPNPLIIINKNREVANRLNIRGTPAFIIGNTIFCKHRIRFFICPSCCSF